MDRRSIGFLLLVQACAVDASGIPPGPDVDLGTADLGVVAPDLGDAGGTDLGSPPDMAPDLSTTCVPRPEICNGSSDDCDLTIDEGVVVGMACDGDGDGCMDGRTACLGGMERCLDEAERVGFACDGTDADDVAEGRWACLGTSLFCEGDCVAAPEICNRRDDDCNGAIDEGGVCGDSDAACRSLRQGDTIYLICTASVGWDDARAGCGRGGYDLAQIEGEAERAFLYAAAGTGRWWVGARTNREDGPGRRDIGTWTWRPSGAAVASELWASGEPSGDGSCGHLAPALDGDLNDLPCSSGLGYLCEGLLVP